MALTMKQLKEMSDEQVIQLIINERRNKLTNVYTPFSERLTKISNMLDNHILIKYKYEYPKPEIKKTEYKHHKYILHHRIGWHYIDSFNPSELPESEEEHIKEMIKEGYSSGQLVYTLPKGKIEHIGWWEIIK